MPLTLISGAGGAGALSFSRTRKLPRGGPDGGDGGRGGDVAFLPSPDINSFSHLKKKPVWRAAAGRPGASQLKSGRGGGDLIIHVPPGTVIKSLQGGILTDLGEAKEKSVFLKGGRGGRGNAFFKTSLSQAPKHVQKGEPGREARVLLEMKPLIQAALTGKVNAGKSAFFNRVTGGRSKEAPYPYTTLEPWLGAIKGFQRPCLLMDIPGIEKGAHKSPARGLCFLRSIQRARVLLHFIDSKDPEPQKSRREIEEELKAFDKRFPWPGGPLSAKKRFLVLSKIDRPGGASRLPGDLPVFRISSRTGEGLEALMAALKKELPSFC